MKFKVNWFVSGRTRTFKHKANAEAYQRKVEAQFKEANELADVEIWTTIDQVYDTRYDCMTVRLAAAKEIRCH